jgi:hypothetical protein
MAWASTALVANSTSSPIAARQRFRRYPGLRQARAPGRSTSVPWRWRRSKIRQLAVPPTAPTPHAHTLEPADAAQPDKSAPLSPRTAHPAQLPTPQRLPPRSQDRDPAGEDHKVRLKYKSTGEWSSSTRTNAGCPSWLWTTGAGWRAGSAAAAGPVEHAGLARDPAALTPARHKKPFAVSRAGVQPTGCRRRGVDNAATQLGL